MGVNQAFTNPVTLAALRLPAVNKMSDLANVVQLITFIFYYYVKLQSKP